MTKNATPAALPRFPARASRVSPCRERENDSWTEKTEPDKGSATYYRNPDLLSGGPPLREAAAR